ncbi:MAG TPA: CHRD domain-containing protein [Bryobacteraceae bacterium]|nr:CHRD domain-containing protein [Bryobacteraceae bacterium]
MRMLKIATLAALVLGLAANGATITYDATLLGTSEVPPTGSPGTGQATVIVDTVAQTMEVIVQFSGLLGTTTASHIHCCTAIPDVGNAGVATTTPTFAGFPLGVTGGTYDHTLDLTLASSYNPAFVTAEGSVANAEAALLAGIAAGDSYLNIHSTVDPGGEIRGYLAVATPEPATFLWAGAALAGLASLRRKRAA